MKRKNPQLSVVVSPGQYAVLKRYSDLAGQSMASIVAELLAAATPSLVAVIQAMELTKNRKEDVPFVLQGLLNRVTSEAAEAQGEMGEVWERVRRATKKP